MNLAGRDVFAWEGGYDFSPTVVVDGPLVFTSGQAGFDDAGELVGPDFESQLRQAYANLARVLEERGASLATVSKVTAYLLRRSDFETLQRVRHEVFSAPYPANTTILAGEFVFPGMLVELEAVAAVGSRRKLEGAERAPGRPDGR
jgi:2-iminobutanoate/2-iminopropanoate deaminase